jgi:Flp pilus assembly protein TadD/4-amino-4-deoxy-L-arabinose transferase-like glycosyltransferase
MAREILAGGVVLDGPFLMAPLYGYALAAVYAITTSPVAVFALQSLLGVATAVMAARLAGALGGVPAAWVAGLLVALDPLCILYDARLLSVSLATFLSTAAALALLRAPASARSAALAGLLLGAAALARANLLLVVPLVAIAILFAARRVVIAGVFVLGFSGPISLALGHNVAHGEAAPIAVNGGINLYRGNNPWFDGVATQDFRLPAERDALATKSRLVASYRSGRWLTIGEADRYWTAETFDAWRERPVRYLALFVRKCVQVLGPREIGDNVDEAAERAASPILEWLPPAFYPAVLLAALAVVGARKREAAPLAALLVGSVGSVAIFFVVTRYRVPFFPLVASFAGCGAAWILDASWSARARALVGMFPLAVVLSLPSSTAALPWNVVAASGAAPARRCGDDTHLLREPAIEARARLGARHLLDEDYGAAEAVFAALVLADPRHAPALVDLAWLRLRRGDVAAAAALAQRAIDVDRCDDKAWSLLGVSRLRAGDARGAIEPLERTLEIDEVNPQGWANLGEALVRAGREAEGRAYLERAERWGPELSSPRAVLGRLDLEAGQFDAAARRLAEAARLQPGRGDLAGLHGLALLGSGDLAGARRVAASARAAGLADAALEALESGIARGGGGFSR